MSVIKYVMAILVAVAHLASANFDMYRIHGQRNDDNSPWGTQPDGYMLFNDDPKSCEDVHPYEFWWERRDVSTDKLGVLCEGKKGCYVYEASNNLKTSLLFSTSSVACRDKIRSNSTQWPWPDITRMEMNFCKDRPDYHFSTSIPQNKSTFYSLTNNSSAIYNNKGETRDGTYYWTLYDLYNNKQGECFAYGGGPGFDCKWPPGYGGFPKAKDMHIWGSRKFRCITKFERKDFVECHPNNYVAEMPGNNSTDTNILA